MRKLKVYGCSILFHKGKQRRSVVAVHNQKEAAKAFDESLYFVQTWCCETGNEEEVKLALEQPGKVIFMETEGIVARELL